MRYLGGKGRIAKPITEILSDTDRQFYLEPFMGGGAVFSRVASNFKHPIGSDISFDLILMWTALRDGWIPQENLSETEYQSLRNSAPSALRGLAGFGASFGGKWFGGYARGGFNGTAPRNHYAESRRAAMRDATGMKDALLLSAPYDSWSPDKRFPFTVIRHMQERRNTMLLMVLILSNSGGR